MNKAIFDVSFFLSYLLPDEEVEHAAVFKEFISGRLVLVEPYVFSLEVVNALLSAQRSKRIKKTVIKGLVDLFSTLPEIEYFYEIDDKKLYSLANENGLSVYDATYLYLKKETGYPLYSLDKKLMSRTELNNE